EDLVLLVAIDQPESIRYANASELADWKLDFDRALAIARENLAAQPKPQVTDVGGGAWLLEGHAYTSSYALWTPKALAALVGAKTEQLIVFAPSPEVLVVAIATDAEAVAHAATLAMTVHKEAPRGVSLIAMAPGADGVPTEVEPAAGPLALVAQMRFMDRFDAYGSLSEPLAALLAAKGDKTPVAPRFVARYGDLGFSAVAVLSRGEKAYLPEADLVLLRDGTGDDAKVLGAARWVELRKVLGDAITTLPDAYPPRYLVARFPTAEELAKMDLVSTDELQK
ncbi:MAG: hypothetical protein KC635_29890, partial [Myxococcales bacterium]|nr:hypothetical protein [Myxococcales bacterium]